MATCCRILAWEISWAEEPGGLHAIGSQSDMTERLALTHYQTLSSDRLCSSSGLMLGPCSLAHNLDRDGNV